MKRYAVVCKIRKIENSNSKINNIVSWIEFKKSDIHYCNGIKELRKYIGLPLHYNKDKKCYTGNEYIAWEVK